MSPAWRDAGLYSVVLIAVSAVLLADAAGWAPRITPHLGGADWAYSFAPHMIAVMAAGWFARGGADRSRRAFSYALIGTGVAMPGLIVYAIDSGSFAVQPVGVSIGIMAASVVIVAASYFFLGWGVLLMIRALRRRRR